MAKMDAKKLTEEISNELLKKIGIEAKAVVEEGKDNLDVVIEGQSLGALIGYHGETLDSFQLILSLILNHQLGGEEWQSVSVDIGGWRQERRDSLKTMVDKAASDIEGQHTEHVSLPIMSANQRREIHILVNENYPDLVSSSEGDEPARFVVIRRK